MTLAESLPLLEGEHASTFAKFEEFMAQPGRMIVPAYALRTLLGALCDTSESYALFVKRFKFAHMKRAAKPEDLRYWASRMGLHLNHEDAKNRLVSDSTSLTWILNSNVSPQPSGISKT